MQQEAEQQPSTSSSSNCWETLSYPIPSLHLQPGHSLHRSTRILHQDIGQPQSWSGERFEQCLQKLHNATLKLYQATAPSSAMVLSLPREGGRETSKNANKEKREDEDEKEVIPSPVQQQEDNNVSSTDQMLLENFIVKEVEKKKKKNGSLMMGDEQLGETGGPFYVPFGMTIVFPSNNSQVEKSVDESEKSETPVRAEENKKDKKDEQEVEEEEVEAYQNMLSSGEEEGKSSSDRPSHHKGDRGLRIVRTSTQAKAALRWKSLRKGSTTTNLPMHKKGGGNVFASQKRGSVTTNNTMSAERRPSYAGALDNPQKGNKKQLLLPEHPNFSEFISSEKDLNLVSRVDMPAYGDYDSFVQWEDQDIEWDVDTEPQDDFMLVSEELRLAAEKGKDFDGVQRKNRKEKLQHATEASGGRRVSLLQHIRTEHVKETQEEVEKQKNMAKTASKQRMQAQRLHPSSSKENEEEKEDGNTAEEQGEKKKLTQQEQEVLLSNEEESNKKKEKGEEGKPPLPSPSVIPATAVVFKAFEVVSTVLPHSSNIPHSRHYSPCKKQKKKIRKNITSPEKSAEGREKLERGEEGDEQHNSNIEVVHFFAEKDLLFTFPMYVQGEFIVPDTPNSSPIHCTTMMDDTSVAVPLEGQSMAIEQEENIKTEQEESITSRQISNDGIDDFWTKQQPEKRSSIPSINERDGQESAKEVVVEKMSDGEEKGVEVDEEGSPIETNNKVDTSSLNPNVTPSAQSAATARKAAVAAEKRKKKADHLRAKFEKEKQQKEAAKKEVERMVARKKAQQLMLPTGPLVSTISNDEMEVDEETGQVYYPKKKFVSNWSETDVPPDFGSHYFRPKWKYLPMSQDTTIYAKQLQKELQKLKTLDSSQRKKVQQNIEEEKLWKKAVKFQSVWSAAAYSRGGDGSGLGRALSLVESPLVPVHNNGDEDRHKMMSSSTDHHGNQPLHFLDSPPPRPQTTTTHFEELAESEILRDGPFFPQFLPRPTTHQKQHRNKKDVREAKNMSNERSFFGTEGGGSPDLPIDQAGVNPSSSSTTSAIKLKEAPSPGVQLAALRRVPRNVASRGAMTPDYSSSNTAQLQRRGGKVNRPKPDGSFAVFCSKQITGRLSPKARHPQPTYTQSEQEQVFYSPPCAAQMSEISPPPSRSSLPLSFAMKMQKQQQHKVGNRSLLGEDWGSSSAMEVVVMPTLVSSSDGIGGENDNNLLFPGSEPQDSPEKTEKDAKGEETGGQQKKTSDSRLPFLFSPSVSVVATTPQPSSNSVRKPPQEHDDHHLQFMYNSPTNPGNRYVKKKYPATPIPTSSVAAVLQANKVDSRAQALVSAQKQLSKQLVKAKWDALHK